MSIQILTGDVRAMLKTLPDESVHCVVTSPPYWGLRDYGVEGQIGLERSLGEHIDLLVDVFRDVRRVLRKDGTFWLNYGDAYASAPNGRSAADTKSAGNDDRTFRDKPISTVGPVRASFRRDGACVTPRLVSRPGDEHRGDGGKEGYRPGHASRIASGGTLKPKDRMLLPARVAIALQEDGWWVRDEIIWHKPNPMPSSVKDRTTPAHEMIYLLSKSAKYFWDFSAMQEPASGTAHARRSMKMPDVWDTGEGAHGTVHRAGREKGKTNRQQQIADNSNPNTARTMGGFNARGDAKERKMAAPGIGIKYNESFSAGVSAEVLPFRNRRSVWTVPPKAFVEAHFATFPPALIEPCIKAGCPEGGTVLDPFFGAGTTGLVCQSLGRNCIGIELNPDYVKIAERRLGLSAVSQTEVYEDLVG